MTMPDGGSSGDGTQAAVLLELGKLSTHVALANQKLDTLVDGLKDHENRLRVLELAKAKIIGGAVTAGVFSGGGTALITWALSRGK